MSIPVYYNSDADLSIVQGKRLAVIGYGNQGAAQAQNLRDSDVAEMSVSPARFFASYYHLAATGLVTFLQHNR